MQQAFIVKIFRYLICVGRSEGISLVIVLCPKPIYAFIGYFVAGMLFVTGVLSWLRLGRHSVVVRILAVVSSDAAGIHMFCVCSLF